MNTQMNSKQRKGTLMRQTIKEQRQYKKELRVYVMPEVARILKQDAKRRHGIMFSKYLEEVLTKRANKVKERNNDY